MNGMINRFKTVMLLATLTALFLWLGYALAGQPGLIIAGIAATLMNFGSYWFSDRIVLRMYRAREVNLRSVPEIYALVSDLAIRAKLPMPKVYLIPEEAPNAFATGRNPRHAAVAVTEGLLRVLDREELAAVIAHELGHIKHRDTLIMTIAGALAGALSMLADMAMWSSLLGAGASEDEDESSNPPVGLLAVLVAPFVEL